MLNECARAKVNLFLHVRGRRPDGYHLLESLVTFADFGDDLALFCGEPLTLDIDGPFAAGLDSGQDNLVLKAARAFVAHDCGRKLGRFALTKTLPVASGIGGGSADAAAALRLLAQANDLSLSDSRLMDAARVLGADVPMCLQQSLRLVSGIGHNLGPPLAGRPCPALLGNPGIGVSTAEIFTRLGLQPGQRHASPPEPAARDLDTLATGTRNDLEPIAIQLVPEIGMLIRALAERQGCRLARMSGSGATCFGLFSEPGLRDAATLALRQAYPEWWFQPVTLLLPESQSLGLQARKP
jgi:4-diphosphocytidyl-2-C-methyl-D-erythritol kinase